MDERERELAGEFNRWYDLVRPGPAFFLSRVTKWNPKAKANVQARHVLRPIPQSQIDGVVSGPQSFLLVQLVRRIDLLEVEFDTQTRLVGHREVAEILCDLDQMEIDFVISSANGTFIDQAECQALRQAIPDAFVYTPKPAMGESVGAAGLWQVIVGTQALHSGELPPLLHGESTIPLRTSASRVPVAGAQCAIVLSCGVNQQVAGLLLRKVRDRR